MFRKESSMLRYYSENGPEHYVPIQKKLIEQAYQMLAEGGELLYSTCTFSVKENEEVIAGLLDAHPDMEVQGNYPGLRRVCAGSIRELAAIFPGAFIFSRSGWREKAISWRS